MGDGRGYMKVVEREGGYGVSFFFFFVNFVCIGAKRT